MIAVVEYGMGNLGSVRNMLKKIKADSIITDSLEEIRKAKKIILPGVGAFDHAIKQLRRRGLYDFLIEEIVREKKPVLGICLGMQLLTKGSEEGNLPGLALIDAYAKKINNENQVVPHMGWNSVNIRKKSVFFPNHEIENRFYFVHSYAVQCNSSSDILTTTNYGIEFVSAFERENIIGVQFHPEKSHKFGINFFKNFVNF